MDRLDKDVTDTDNVKFQCENEWRRLRDVQTELQNLAPIAPVADHDACAHNGSSATISIEQILQEHEKRLKAELQALREREPKTLPESFDLQLLVLVQDQVKRLDQLQDTLTYLRAKRSEVLENIKDEEELYSHLKSVNDTLKKKTAALGPNEAAGETEIGLDAVLAEMTTKLSKVTEMEQYFKNTLKEILSKHFPISSQKHAEKTPEGSREADKMLSLMPIVGMLIEQTLNSPDQPYIDISERFWPPNIEFLLRCQIVVKDPQNSRKLKLVPFHL